MVLSKGAITFADVQRMTLHDLTEWEIRLVEAQGTHYYDFDTHELVKIERPTS